MQKAENIFELILPVQQSLDKANAYGNGYCRGYGQIWEKLIGTAYDQEAWSEESWEDLLTAGDYEWPMPFSKEIKKAQPKILLKPLENKLFENSIVCEEFADLLEQLLADSVINALEEAKIPTFFEIQLSNIERAPLFIKACGNPISKSKSGWCNSWHQLCLYVDLERRVHVFDPNIGWFRSREKNPDIKDLSFSLSSIFQILDYQNIYNVARFKRNPETTVPLKQRQILH